jgi:hypothetical protein
VFPASVMANHALSQAVQLPGAGAPPEHPSGRRGFRTGFNSWPCAATPNAVADTDAFPGANGDPGETRNLVDAGAYTPVVTELRAKVRARWAQEYRPKAEAD